MDALNACADQDGGASRVEAAETGIGFALAYLGAGVVLGIVFVQAEIVSWFRIHEMFRFESFHMYGVIAVAVSVAALGQMILRRVAVRSLSGAPIALEPKVRTPRNTRYWLGGGVFGLGWALLGACPGPIFTLIGAGATVYVVPLAAALAGTWTYGRFQTRLPH
ncbi:MAG TPA: DUF6691 family protein [Vicinamibacterales bacterium]|nr:DUF6691 family protein [Vicinamibacterales bacterium]